MDRSEFKTRLQNLLNTQEALITLPNTRAEHGNGIFDRYLNPVLTAAHAPIIWRYDLNYETNPAPFGTTGHQRSLQRGRHGVRREDRAGSAR